MPGTTIQPFSAPAYTPDPLAQFLSRVVPWGNGFVGLHAWTPKHDQRTQFRRGGGGEAFASLDEYGQMQQFVAMLNRNGDEAFVCMSARAGIKETKTYQSGRVVRKASRKERPVAVKAFWLDLDVKPTKYATQAAALAALKTFCSELGLMAGFIVNSGGGVHCYFVLDKAISPEVWAPLAGKLAAAAKAKGLKADSVTTDITRVMRLPTSLNQKLPGNPRPVEIIEQGPDMTLQAIEAALASYVPVVTPGVRKVTDGRPPLDPNIFPPRPPITYGPEFARVSADLEKNRIATSVDLLRAACPVVRDSEARGGDGDIEPLWFELAKLCHYVEDGRAYFHRLSDQDVRYEHAAADKKFDEVQRAGWPQCSTIALASPAASAICQTCAFNGKGQSPINYATRGLLGTTGAPLQLASTPLAPQTTYAVNGASAFVAMPQTGNPIFVADLNAVGHDLDADGYIVDSSNKRVFKTRVSDMKCGWEPARDGKLMLRINIMIPSGTQANDDKVVTFLAGDIGSPGGTSMIRSQGLTFEPRNLPQVVTLMDDWTSYIRIKLTANADARLGWVYNNGVIEGFSYAGYIFDTSGSRLTSMSTNEALTPRGNLADWKKAANFFVGKGCVEMEAIMATAFASPLVTFTNVDGVIVFARADTGFGKTASLMCSASVWGSRSQAPSSTTTNFIDAEIAKKHNLPVYWDEIVPGPKQNNNKFGEMVLRVTSGTERGRNDRANNQGLVRISCLMLVCASNHSLTEMASSQDTSAQAARILEIEMSDAIKRLGYQQSQVGEIRKMLEANYGQAGLVYSEFLGKHHAAVEQMVTATIKRFETKLNLGQAERFWLAAAATLLVGATISKKLGLIDFDIMSMEKFLLSQLRKQQTTVREMSIDANNPDVQLGRVSSFMNSTQNWIVTDTLAKQGGLPNACILRPHDLTHFTRMREFVLRYAHADKKLLISEDKLKAWCVQREISYRELLKTLLKHHYCTRPKKQRSLSAGTALNSSPETVLIFDLTFGPNMTLVVEEDGV